MNAKPLVIGLGALLGLGLVILSQTATPSEAQESQAPQGERPVRPAAPSAPAETKSAPAAKPAAPAEKPAAPAEKPAEKPAEQPAAEAPVAPAEPQAALEPLRQGSVLRPTRGVMIGLAGVYEEEGQTFAWFNAGSGSFSYAVEVQVGQRVRAAGFELEVLEIDLEQRWVRYAWIRKDAAAQATEAVAGKGELRLREMGVYRLASGEVLTVGNLSSQGEVTIRVFPKTYAQDPMQGYDNHVEAKAGAVFKGVRTLRVAETSLSTQDQAGWVKIQLR